MITSSNIIDNVIDEFIANKRAFTAFEVTLEARNRGSTERHLDQRQYIHGKMADEVNFGNYVKTLIDIGNTNNSVTANLYHPIGYNVASYSTAKAVTQSSKNTKKVDMRSTLLVSSKFIKNLGLKPQDKVFISVKDDVLYVTRSDEVDKARNRNGICYYVVNENYNVRITHSTLKSAKMAGSEYEIIDGPEIMIKLVR